MEFPSKLIEDAVNQIAKLPGIGKKTALRLALFLLKEDEVVTEGLTQALTDLRTKIKYCRQCHVIADDDLCQICRSPRRDKATVCVVQDSRDVMAIENTGQYQGLYHVLGGIISPLEGIGPGDIRIDSLMERICEEGSEVKEIILALSATMEGDTTAFYLSKKLKDQEVNISTIARGIPVGGELEYADEVTLGRSIITRTHYERS
ncbi:recombination mediator RecR [Roseivirga sp. BDSF3-8]|uniref:recombination mediator RecR n=1 Tax=Roseivirga sp. BDSF3-8 TaxID=3241598 RepID=UPI0035322BC9